MVKAGLLFIAMVVVVGWTSPAASAATCADYSNQADAQRAMDTRDADGDGIYCESLPCPCLKPGDSGGGGGEPDAGAEAQELLRPPAGCAPSRVQPREVPEHQAALHRGGQEGLASGDGAQPKGRRRPPRPPARGRPDAPGFDRDEYPAAVGRGRPNGDKRGLVRGINPVGWMADVAYVPSSENRSHGSSLGAKLRGFCDGTRFQYAFG